MPDGLVVDQRRAGGLPRRPVQAEEVDALLAPHLLMELGGHVPRGDRPVRGAGIHLRPWLAGVVDHVHVLVVGVRLVCRPPNLRGDTEERVSRCAVSGEVAAVPRGRGLPGLGRGRRCSLGGRDGLGIGDVDRVVGLEGRDHGGGAEGSAAVGGFDVPDGVLGMIAADALELAERHVHVTVSRHRDVRGLDVVHRLAELHRAGPRHAVIRGA